MVVVVYCTPTRTPVQPLMKELKKCLDKHDGGCRRNGKAMKRLAAASGYGVEQLRSMYYGRRTSRDQDRLDRLLTEISLLNAKA